MLTHVDNRVMVVDCRITGQSVVESLAFKAGRAAARKAIFVSASASEKDQTFV